MNELIIKSSPWKFIFLLLISLAFVGAGVFMLFAGGPRPVAWLSIVFFGACAAVFFWQTADSRPRLIFTDDGVYDRTLGIGTIPWPEIDGAYVRSIQGNDFICLELAHPEKYLDRLSPIRRSMANANKALGFTPVSLNLSGLDGNTEEVFEFLLKRLEHHRIARSEPGVGGNSW